MESAKHEVRIDASRIYLLGTSGGGYTGLLREITAKQRDRVRAYERYLAVLSRGM